MPAAARVQLACCALIAALLLSGCGGGGTSTGGEATIASGSTATTATANAKQKPRSKQTSTRASSTCQSQLGSFVGSMDGLRRRLAVGVTYEQYVDEVHAIGSTYHRIPTDEVEIDCLTAVGTPAEKAYNRYIVAANDWGGCVGEAGCESATIEPVLQRRWRIASHLLSEAQQGLQELS
ncbi:MAG TPA: hypothetical protein VFX44_04665 [Solirubrobacterales bacterium]|nr:hypothetical protein [Solirubrobacterales bacterium]